MRCSAVASAEAPTLDATLSKHVDRPTGELSPVRARRADDRRLQAQPLPGRALQGRHQRAVRLAKSFGGTDGHKYVNGVLDKAAIEWRPPRDQTARQRR